MPAFVTKSVSHAGTQEAGMPGAAAAASVQADISSGLQSWVAHAEAQPTTADRSFDRLSSAAGSGGAAAVRAEAVGAAAGGERHAVTCAVLGRPAPHIAQGPELATGVQFLHAVGR